MFVGGGKRFCGGSTAAATGLRPCRLHRRRLLLRRLLLPVSRRLVLRVAIALHQSQAQQEAAEASHILTVLRRPGGLRPGRLHRRRLLLRRLLLPVSRQLVLHVVIALHQSQAHQKARDWHCRCGGCYSCWLLYRGCLTALRKSVAVTSWVQGHCGPDKPGMPYPVPAPVCRLQASLWAHGQAQHSSHWPVPEALCADAQFVQMSCSLE